MEYIGIVTYREKLDQVVEKYSDFLGEEAESLCHEHRIPTAKKLQAELASIEDAERLLKIGIVGRVKSGKSSLLNALIFEGQSILPKAATPMTAALTTLSHGDTVQAEVEFFTPEDIKDMKAQAEEYKKKVQKLTSELLEKKRVKLSERLRKEMGSTTEDEESVQHQAAGKIREKHPILAASYEQYEKINNSNTSIGSLEESKVLNLSGDLMDLQSQLVEYVGADGPYMPFTKSVNIRLPQDNLKDIQIVDTPGINDPIQSREARTREYLSECDVVLVVSPAGQFINEKDMELMDRITSKEGIRELYVVAAQVDTQMFGSMKGKNGGLLDYVLKDITETLGGALRNAIEDLKKKNLEVGDEYDQLLEGQSRIIYSAGLCESMKQRFGQQEGWDEGMAHLWCLLRKAYPDYFSAENERLSKLSLDKLANISAIQEVVDQVRAKKGEILKKRIDNYVYDKRRSLRALHTGLSDYVKERQNLIEREDLQSIKKKKEILKTALSNASEDIKLAYQGSIEEIISELRKEALDEVKREGEALLGDLGDQEGTGSEQFEVKRNWLARFFGGCKYETKHYKTIRTNAFSNGMSSSCRDVTNSFVHLVEQKKEKWRRALLKQVTEALRESFDDDDHFLDASMIRRVTKRTIASILIPEFNYKKSLPKSLRPQGVLKERRAEKFIDEAHNYIDSFLAELDEKIKEYASSLKEEMSKFSLEERLLERHNKELASLEKSVENKEMELKRISTVKDELESMEMNP